MQQAVLAIEDQGFYSHPGINPVRLAAAALTNIFGTNPNLVGYSTITQQLSRMFFLAGEFNAELSAGERSYGRKLREMLMSLVLERRASKDEILELYLNDVYLGQRGSFAIHGVAEAARLFFGKDVANVSISEAAVIAGVIQSPASRSPLRQPETCDRAAQHRAACDGRRGVHLRGGGAARDPRADAGGGALGGQRSALLRRHGERAGRHGVPRASRRRPGGWTSSRRSTSTCSGRRSMRCGTASRTWTGSWRGAAVRRVAQAALIAVDPRTGDILAMVGGRSYNNSQFNRAVMARRQPGSVFKPFVYLAAFERALEDGRTDLTPASLTTDEPATFTFGDQVWEPKNYDDYDGQITWRRALAMSRNLGTIHVGETIGFDTIASLWRKVGVGTPPRAFPSITLGVFELTPLEVAQAYTLFLNGGAVRPLRAIQHIETSARDLKPKEPALKRVAHPEAAFLVTSMMRSVINEGTGAGARASGFELDAAGKSGTTNDLRDAWFVGFTPELLTVVWVGLDDNRPVGLSGTQAALPIWTEFMKSALAGRPNLPFDAPDGISFAEIDRDTGKLAAPRLPPDLQRVLYQPAPSRPSTASCIDGRAQGPGLRPRGCLRNQT